MTDLSNKKVLVLVSNRGVEQDELKSPVDELRQAGAQVTVAAPDSGEVESLVGDWDLGEKFPVDEVLANVSADEYDLLLLPGGTLNADNLRLDVAALSVTKNFASGGKPIASICHGPWMLVESGLTQGKTLTSYQSIKTDVINAGGTWKDTAVSRCDAQGWVLITSRNPGDLNEFNQAIIDELSA
ncbi:type 1 glutamine amidotransferase domain-containing protein [Glutamicibacter uratoxydans]|uniref:type 1 glutamine amidotransferase domain-containing protein n=1 Tax=Glutamicibacter uratoxydans TaxID=43667 RepID=UPI003D6EDB11